MKNFFKKAWMISLAGRNTLAQGVYFLLKVLAPDVHRKAFLPTHVQKTLWRDNVLPADPQKLLEFHRLAEFGKHSSGIFHDMMSPLTTILLTLEEIRGSNEFIDEESIERALAASDRIKEFVSAARKGLKPYDSIQAFSPASEIRDAVRFLEHKARRSHVMLEYDLDESIRIQGAPLRFFQIALNLMSNAIDAYDGISHEDKSINIFLERSHEKILMTVSDRGCGIPKDSLSKIFDPFYSTKKSKGLGLGLATLKDHMESFEGSIEVESLVGFGTTFTASFPLAPSQKAAFAAFDREESFIEGRKLAEA